MQDAASITIFDTGGRNISLLLDNNNYNKSGVLVSQGATPAQWNLGTMVERILTLFPIPAGPSPSCLTEHA